MSVDYFAPFPATPRGNSYIVLFTDRLSRRADMYAVSVAEFTAQGTADILVNKCIPLWGCPTSLLFDNGLHICSKLSLAVYKLLGMRKIATSVPLQGQWWRRARQSHHGSDARDGHQRKIDDWDIHLPHVEFA